MISQAQRWKCITILPEARATLAGEKEDEESSASLVKWGWLRGWVRGWLCVTWNKRHTQGTGALCEKYGNNIAGAKQNRPPCMWNMRDRSGHPLNPQKPSRSKVSSLRVSFSFSLFFHFLNPLDESGRKGGRREVRSSSSPRNPKPSLALSALFFSSRAFTPFFSLF